MQQTQPEIRYVYAEVAEREARKFGIVAVNMTGIEG